jgi:hypothetical protein
MPPNLLGTANVDVAAQEHQALVGVLLLVLTEHVQQSIAVSQMGAGGSAVRKILV